ncbi:hypothetical protein [uncultured Selenomonas sp.]|uniref:hypothetical protein n=1 Tax=uncultured Selenomonas sp. TaxID=159275 RepID=UPI0028E5EED3|nr:hypothetical protein [uncultured Selenomonas sp.]
METEAASAAVQTAGFIHPVMADVMTILSFVLVVASVGIASVATYYAWRQSGGTIDAVEKDVAWLRKEAERLSNEIKSVAAKDSMTASEITQLKEKVAQLEAGLAEAGERPAAPPPEPELPAPEPEPELPAPEPEPELPEPEPEPEPAPEPEPEPEEEEDDDLDLDALLDSKPIWQDLLDDYHALCDDFDREKGAELCMPIITKYGLHLLVCSDHAAVENGKAMPKFEEVEDLSEATFWAYDIPGQPDDFAVVPSPMFPYDQKLHETGGMKETFAARYEAGMIYDHVTVDMPALFSKRNDKWNIEQPGLLRLVE